MKKLTQKLVLLGGMYVIYKKLDNRAAMSDKKLPSDSDFFKTQKLTFINPRDYQKDDSWVKKSSRLGRNTLLVKIDTDKPEQSIEAESVVSLFQKITGIKPADIYDYKSVHYALSSRANVGFYAPLDYENRNLPVFVIHGEFMFMVDKSGQVDLYYLKGNDHPFPNRSVTRYMAINAIVESYIKPLFPERLSSLVCLSYDYLHKNEQGVPYRICTLTTEHGEEFFKNEEQAYIAAKTTRNPNHPTIRPTPKFDCDQKCLIDFFSMYGDGRNVGSQYNDLAIELNTLYEAQGLKPLPITECT